MLDYFIMSLGFIPYFTTRTFVPLFSAAVMTRLGGTGLTWIDPETAALLEGAPAWFIDGWMLAGLGLLALAEVAAAKSPELRELALSVDAKTKAMTVFALCVLLAPSDLRHAVSDVAFHGFNLVQSVDYVWAVLVAAATWFCAGLRGAIHRFLIELDEDDDLGLQGLLSWLEDSIGFVGVIFVVFLPLLSLIVLGLTVAGLWLIRRYLEHREEKAKIPCEQCAAPVAPCGPRCPSCRHLRRQVFAVGVLGTIKDTLAPDMVRHSRQLLANKRCPTCGERLKERRLDQRCGACLAPPFANQQAVAASLASIREQLPRILLVLLAVGFVPILGLIVGVIYYRLSIIASLRCYLPRGTGMMARWGVRLINLVILCFQPVPILGMLTLPLMCLTNYGVYSSLLERQSTVAFRTVPGYSPAGG